jgi:hypothetical protein
MKKGGVIFLLVGIFLLSINFISATTAPTALIIESNVTAVYDEGNFSVNWTSGGGEVKNYSIYVAVGGSVFTKAWNNSVTGYSFNNWTEGNYTFIVGALNTTGSGNEANATTNISIYIDRTAPVISLPVYTNATAKKNSTTLTLNISVVDASSGVTGTICLIDVNGTNQSIALATGWCNGTIGLEGVSDGNTTLTIYANDTVNIRGLNNSFVVLADTTEPVPSASCSPSSVIAGESFPCSCSGSDVTSGLNSSANSGSTTSPDGVSIAPIHDGVFTYTCSVTDYAGNSKTGTATYTVTLPISRSSSGSTTTSFYTKTIPKTSQDFSEIQQIETSLFSGGGLAVKERISFKLENENHYLGVKELTSSSVKIEIASDPVEAEMNVGEEKKFDLDSDGYYDVLVIVNGIGNNRADLTMNYIHELISADSTSPITEQGEDIIPESSIEKKTNWTWVVFIFLLIIAGFFIWYSYHKENKRNR